MRHQLELNSDIVHVLEKEAAKHKTTLNKVIVKILQQWVDDKDSMQFPIKTKQITINTPPEKTSMNCIELEKLQKLLTSWIDVYGRDAVLYNESNESVLYRIKHTNDRGF